MRQPPTRATNAIVAATIVVWVMLTLTGVDKFADISGGVIAQRFMPGGGDLNLTLPSGAHLWMVPRWLTPVTATLLHAGFIHIGFNMLMLVYCGRFVEVALGPRGLVILYLAGAYVAALAHVLANPGSPTPMIGASGAASAVFGAYALLYGRRKVTLANPALNQFVNILWLAAAWIGLQLLVGYATSHGGPGIAIAAHIGGFLAGLAMARPLLLLRYRTA